jgi:RNA polymerase sigma-70 factor (ECF subfamily)
MSLKSYNIQNKGDVSKIVEGCKKGDRKMQQILFELTYGKSMSAALRYSPDKASAMDVVSDSYLKVFSKIDTFDESGSLEGWIRRIVVNTAIDVIRRNKGIYFEDVQNAEDVGLNLENNFMVDGLESADLSPDEVMDIIQKLSPGYKAVFNMFVFEEMSHKEISEALEISEGASKSNLSRARNTIKKEIELLKEKSLRRQETMKELYK